MRRLKEAVKKGELTPSEAMAELKEAATVSNTVPYVFGTKTWKWLKRKQAEANQ